MTNILQIAAEYNVSSITNITESSACLNIPRSEVGNVDKIELYLNSKGFEVTSVDESSTHYEFEIAFDL